MLSGYLGKSEAFEDAISSFGEAYAGPERARPCGTRGGSASR